MQTMQFSLTSAVHIGVLDAAMRAQFGARISGLSLSGDALRVLFLDDFTAQDETDAQAVIDAHDPAFVQTVRGGNLTSVTVNVPRNLQAASAVTLVIDGVNAPATIPLAAGVAVYEVESEKPVIIDVAEFATGITDAADPDDEPTIEQVGGRFVVTHQSLVTKAEFLQMVDNAQATIEDDKAAVPTATIEDLRSIVIRMLNRESYEIRAIKYSILKKQ